MQAARSVKGCWEYIVYTTMEPTGLWNSSMIHYFNASAMSRWLRCTYVALIGRGTGNSIESVPRVHESRRAGPNTLSLIWLPAHLGGFGSMRAISGSEDFD